MPTPLVTIDTHYLRSQFDAAYLVVGEGACAVIDTGTAHAIGPILAAIASAGLTPADVSHVILTHVHLDHAGGAGALMAELPAATLVVHPRGARHMIDPTALIAGASAVYGADEVARLYGEIMPTPASRVLEASDGMVVPLAGRPLELVHTPGHAKHHLSVWDEATRTWCTGDSFGMSYREFDTAAGPFIVPTTSPVQFDPVAMVASIDLMAAREPLTVRPTHYDAVSDVPRLAADLREQIARLVELAEKSASIAEPVAAHADLVEAINEYWIAAARAHGVTLPDAEILALLGLDIDLNAQGLLHWYARTNPA